jgi:hypothetical protein
MYLLMYVIVSTRLRKIGLSSTLRVCKFPSEWQYTAVWCKKINIITIVNNLEYYEQHFDRVQITNGLDPTRITRYRHKVYPTYIVPQGYLQTFSYDRFRTHTRLQKIKYKYEMHALRIFGVSRAFFSIILHFSYISSSSPKLYRRRKREVKYFRPQIVIGDGR